MDAQRAGKEGVHGIRYTEHHEMSRERGRRNIGRMKHESVITPARRFV